MRLLTTLALLALCATASAVPAQLTHQGRLVDAAGAPLDGANTVRFSMYDAPAGGAPLWTEELTLDFDNGFYSAVLGGGGNPLDDSLFGEDALYLSLAINSGPELPGRQPIASVPWARRAGTAVDVAGGIVDATEIRLNGTTIIDSTGAFVGLPDDLTDGDADTLADLACLDGELAAWSSGDGAWTCVNDEVRTGDDVVLFATSMALDLAAGSSVDGTPISTLSLDDVLSHLSNTPIELGVNSLIGGAPISTGPHTSELEWTAIKNRPPGLDDGDDDTIITELDWTAIKNRPAGLDDGDDDTIVTSLPWTSITGRPAGLDDGDDDTIVTSLPWTSITGRPAGLDDGDDVLSEAQVETYVTNGPLSSLSVSGTLTASGIVREPNKPWFIATDSNTWQSCANQWVEVSYNHVSARGGNSGGWYNKSNGRFTAPADGLYLFVSSHYVYPAASGLNYVHHQIGVQGSRLSGGGRDHNTYNMVGVNSGAEGTYNSSSNVTRILALKKGEYVSTNVYCSGSGNYRYGAHSYFAGVMLHAF